MKVRFFYEWKNLSFSRWIVILAFLLVTFMARTIKDYDVYFTYMQISLPLFGTLWCAQALMEHKNQGADVLRIGTKYPAWYYVSTVFYCFIISSALLCGSMSFGSWSMTGIVDYPAIIIVFLQGLFFACLCILLCVILSNVLWVLLTEVVVMIVFSSYRLSKGISFVFFSRNSVQVETLKNYSVVLCCLSVVLLGMSVVLLKKFFLG